MKPRWLKNSKIIYLGFCIPFVLAFLSWAFFPIFAEWFVVNVFRYESLSKQAGWQWSIAVRFFYTWYTFLAIGVAGVWAVAATLTRAQKREERKTSHPMISLIVPAHNEEKSISKCIRSLVKCAEEYNGLCEIIVVDDGSRDYTYEIAWATLGLCRKRYPRVHGKVVRLSANLGKVDAIKTGVDRARGNIIGVVDADSWWAPNTLSKLVDYMLSNGKKGVTGYVHPSQGNSDQAPYVILQQLEYSQGLGIVRCAQSLGNNVLVIPGAIGLYDADVLRRILSEKNIRSVTEDLEITLEMHKRGASVGYASVAKGSTIAPSSFDILWKQRLRWFVGWLHNTLNIHKELLFKKGWLTLLLWYCYFFEYGGAVVDLTALGIAPFLFWFAPDRISFVLNLLIFVSYGFLIGIINQAIALKYAYNKHNHEYLIFYTPFYPILRLINILARLTSSVKYFLGDHGNWHKT